MIPRLISGDFFYFLVWNFCEAESNLKNPTHHTNSLTFPDKVGIQKPRL